MDTPTVTAKALAKKIPLMEMFGPTFQGEGALCGTMTYFMRFGLCDFDCVMCDSRHAVDPNQVKALAKWQTQDETLHDFLKLASNRGVQWVTFSGGNPCIHNLSHLSQELTSCAFKINVETQGTRFPEWLNYVDLITVSPKGPGMGEVHNPEQFMGFMEKACIAQEQYATEICLKVVIFDERDLEFALSVKEQAQLVGYNGPLWLSLGNSYPPQHANTEQFGKDLSPEEFDNRLKVALLRDYKDLCDNILNDARFSNAIFLPQLHVLTWANKAEV